MAAGSMQECVDLFICKSRGRRISNGFWRSTEGFESRKEDAESRIEWQRNVCGVSKEIP